MNEKNRSTRHKLSQMNYNKTEHGKLEKLEAVLQPNNFFLKKKVCDVMKKIVKQRNMQQC